MKFRIIVFLLLATVAISVPIPQDFQSYDNFRVAKIVGASAAVGVIASAAIAAVAEIIVLAVNRRGELNRLKAENERLRDAAGKLAVDAGELAYQQAESLRDLEVQNPGLDMTNLDNVFQSLKNIHYEGLKALDVRVPTQKQSIPTPTLFRKQNNR